MSNQVFGVVMYRPDVDLYVEAGDTHADGIRPYKDKNGITWWGDGAVWVPDTTYLVEGADGAAVVNEGLHFDTALHPADKLSMAARQASKECNTRNLTKRQYVQKHKAAATARKTAMKAASGSADGRVCA